MGSYKPNPWCCNTNVQHSQHQSPPVGVILNHLICSHYQNLYYLLVSIFYFKVFQAVASQEICPPKFCMSFLVLPSEFYIHSTTLIWLFQACTWRKEWVVQAPQLVTSTLTTTYTFQEGEMGVMGNLEALSLNPQQTSSVGAACQVFQWLRMQIAWDLAMCWTHQAMILLLPLSQVSPLVYIRDTCKSLCCGILSIKSQYWDFF